MGFIGKAKHSFVAGTVPKGNDFVVFLITYRCFYSVDFFLLVTVFANKIACENIVYKFCPGGKHSHFKLFCKRLYPYIKRRSNNVGFGGFSVYIINEIQSILAE